MRSKIKYLLLADNVSFDAKTRKPTLMGVFTDVGLAGDTEITLNFVVVGQISVDPSVDVGTEGVLKVTLLKPDGSELKSEEISGVIDKGREIIFSCFFRAVTFKEKGQYKISVSLNGEVPIKDGADFSLRVNDGRLH